ncbi:MAG TPA: ABC transporter substrate-binding protein, partial [Dehalococcoidia bacterium]
MSAYESDNYWKRIAASRVSRRRALGGGAAATSLMALALAGCGTSNNNKSSNAGSNAPAGNAPSGGATTAAGTPSSSSAAPPTAQSVNVGSATAAAAKVKTGGTYTAGISRDATNLDSAKSQDVYSAYVQAQIVEPLFIGTNDFKIAGNTVDTVENPDNTTYLFHLHPGIKFQDGTDFNADAVKWNLQRHIDDKTSVRNADVTPITAMESVDANTLKITVKAPYAPFLSKLTGGAGAMYSPAAYQKLGSNVSNDLTGAGSGPFKFTSWQHDNQIQLDKNASYWRKDANGVAYPYLDRLVLKPIPDENTREANLKTGDLDYCEQPPPKDVKALQSNSDLTYKQVPGLTFDFIMMEVEKDPFQDKRVRQALSYSLDRQAIVDTVFFGTRVIADTEIPGSLFGSIQGPYLKQDIAKAKSLLQQAGKSSVDFTIQYSNASPTLQQAFELMKDQISPAGFNMTLQPLEFATVVDNGNKGAYQAGGLGWNGAVDPDGFCYQLFHTGAGFNLSHISDSNLDALMDKGQQTLDVAARTDIYHQVMQALIDLQPFIIYDWGVYQQTTRKNVQNFQL